MSELDKKKYEVTGTDWEGDQHVFRTDSRARARDMRNTFNEDLQDVTMSGPVDQPADENADPAPSGDQGSE